MVGVWNGERDCHFAVYNAQRTLIDDRCIFIAVKIVDSGAFHLLQKDYEIGTRPGNILIAGSGVEGHLGDFLVVDEGDKHVVRIHKLALFVGVCQMATDRESTLCVMSVTYGFPGVHREGCCSSVKS